jgi:hypothetical protein
MLTSNELRDLLADNYTAVELVDLLELDSSDIVDEFSMKIEEKYDEILQSIRDDLGYDPEEDEDA